MHAVVSALILIHPLIADPDHLFQGITAFLPCRQTDRYRPADPPYFIEKIHNCLTDLFFSAMKEKDHEFITADPVGGDFPIHDIPKTARNHLQRPVTRVMAQLIICLFQAVHIYGSNRRDRISEPLASS